MNVFAAKDAKEEEVKETSIRLSTVLYERIAEVARVEHRSFNAQVNMALEEYFGMKPDKPKHNQTTLKQMKEANENIKFRNEQNPEEEQEGYFDLDE